jgi:hypothetical protein
MLNDVGGMREIIWRSDRTFEILLEPCNRKPTTL